ncbi:MAG: ribosome small subunit-dependent GTPase A [Acidimicrobiales bacterium]
MPQSINVGALASLGWNDRVAALFADHSGESWLPARVVRVERTRSVVITPDGSESLADADVLPSVGDWVVLQDNSIRHVMPRWSELTRRDPERPGEQTLASNVDLVMIVAPADRLSEARVERELAVAWDSGAVPLVVLTKVDLAAPDVHSSLVARLVGVDVVASSVVTNEGVDEIRAVLRPDRTAVLLGPSGAGKSSLANAVLGVQALATAEVRSADNRGRHTTTSRQLLAVPGGGVIIDTPGLRSLGLASDVGLDAVFPDIDEHAAQCRFSDCRHEVEPGCAVLSAISESRLDPARLTSFRKLQREMEASARRDDPLRRQAQLQLWKARTKAARSHDKRRFR